MCSLPQESRDSIPADRRCIVLFVSRSRLLAGHWRPWPLASWQSAEPECGSPGPLPSGSLPIRRRLLQVEKGKYKQGLMLEAAWARSLAGLPATARRGSAAIGWGHRHHVTRRVRILALAA
jgi:hypothetical protein